MTRVLRSVHPYSAANPEITICIPTFRAPNPRLDRLLASLFAHTHIPYATVVVDCEGESRGYTIPQNEAIREAQTEIVVAANDDVTVRSGWYEPMLAEIYKGPRVWCVTPDMTHKDGPQVFAPYFMMWRRSAWMQLGELDPRFTFWCSDIDLARRMADAGVMPVRVPLPEPIEHEPGGTTQEEPGIRQRMNDAAWADLCRYQEKWGVTAEVEKGRLAQLTLGNITWPP